MTEAHEFERLRLARASLAVTWDEADLRRLAAGLADRRRTQRQRRALAGGAAALILFVAFTVGARHRGTPGARPSIARRTAAPWRTEPLSLLPGAPLADLARDRARAEALLDSFALAPDTHPTLPNVSYAGYHLGAPPAAPATRVVDVKAAPFHAAGDGVTDDTQAIRQALRAVERGGGVVYFPDGQYLVSDVLFVHGSGTVLRGASRDRTRLVFTRPLAAALGPNTDDRGDSRWQWTGGLLWFVPRQHYTYPEDGGELRWRGDGPIGAQFLSALTGARARGDRDLEVADAHGLRPGALVVVALDASDALVDAGWRREPRPGREPDFARVRWPVEVAAVEGHTVRLRQPLRFDLPPSLHPRLEVFPEGALVAECGLERMTIVMRRGPDPEAPPGSAGWNGPFFQDAFHGFARDLTVVDADQVFGAVASKNLSFAGIAATSSGEGLRAPRFSVRRSSHDVLVADLRLEGREGWRARLEGSGLALSRITGRLQALMGRAVDTVLTDVAVDAPNDSPEGLAGLRVLGWRLDRAPAPSRNLYDAERSLLPAPR
jgi:hypothetical protein